LRRSATSGFLVEKHLPKEYRSKFTWRQFAGLLKRAAEGQQDVAEVSTALRIVRSKASSVSRGLPLTEGAGFWPVNEF
jgi:hypothetical protein